ncbi:hypothetical protein FOZ63_007842, partial [Perkinsus olseni]
SIEGESGPILAPSEGARAALVYLSFPSTIDRLAVINAPMLGAQATIYSMRAPSGGLAEIRSRLSLGLPDLHWGPPDWESTVSIVAEAKES